MIAAKIDPGRADREIAALKEDYFVEAAQSLNIRERDARDLYKWAVEGRVPSVALEVVLDNNLYHAMVHWAGQSLAPLIRFIRIYLPKACYGSPEQVDMWCKYHAERRKLRGEQP